MSSLSIRHDIDKVARDFQARWTVSNLRFAVALTLTRLAEEGKVAVKQALPAIFTVRRNWIVGGIRHSPASKTTLQSTIYSLDSGGRRSFMALQEFGGVKTPDGGTHIAIPLKAVKPTERTIIPQVLKPKSLLGGSIKLTNKRTGRVRVVSAQGYKAIKVDGAKPGVQVILIRRGVVRGKNTNNARGGRYNDYVPAWLLVPRSYIRETDFLRRPVGLVLRLRTEPLLRQNLSDVLNFRK